MSRRMLLPVAMGALLLGGVPALADEFGSTETTTEPRSCSADMSDNHYSTPQGSDCRNADGSYNPDGMYQATHWTNDVKCGSKNQLTPEQANATGVRVYGAGDPAAQSGSVGTCSDGSGPVPVQGRAGLSGSPATGPKVIVDGDKDNGNATAQGYVIVEAKPQPAPPTVRCGDEYNQGGRADSDSPQDRDTQAECGG